VTWTTDDIPEEVRGSVGQMANVLLDEETCLLAVTGSLANLTWRAGWSDVDLLLVRRSLPGDWLQCRVGRLSAAGQVSMFTAAEAASGAIPPRVLNAFRAIALDGRGVLAHDLRWKLPDFDLATGAAVSLLDLPQALLLLRRQLASYRIEVRVVYKLCILIARIELRAVGVEPDTSDEVVDEAAARFHGLGHGWLPTLDEVSHLGWSAPTSATDGSHTADAVEHGGMLLLAAQHRLQMLRSAGR
jgi:hypothetical protein